MTPFDVQLVLSQDDILRGLRAAHLRHAGKTRLLIQTILLALVAVGGLVAFFFVEEKKMSCLLLSVLAVLVGALMLGAPEIRLRSMAAEAAKQTLAHLWVFEAGVGFGQAEPAEADLRAYDSFTSARDGDLLVWQFDGGDIVILKETLFSEEQWRFLCEKVENNPAYPKRTRHIS